MHGTVNIKFAYYEVAIFIVYRITLRELNWEGWGERHLGYF